jgi:hypothetical protein
MGPLWATANIRVVRLTWRVSFCGDGGMLALEGPCPGVPWGGQAGWPNHTVKKVYKLYWSTPTHTSTHTHLWIGESTWPQGPQKLGEGWQFVVWLLPQPPLDKKGLKLRPHLLW